MRVGREAQADTWCSALPCGEDIHQRRQLRIQNNRKELRQIVK
jgi:hypothetical protein